MSTTSDVNAALRRLQGEVDRLTRERDEAIHAAAEGNGCAQALERQLADSQAECAALLALLALAVEWMEEDGCDCGSDDPRCTLCEVKAALSRPPGSREALRAMLMKAVDVAYRQGAKDAADDFPGTVDGEVAAIVARLLPTPQDGAREGEQG